MANPRIARRLPVLALVVVAHVAALFLLVILTRTQLLRRVEEQPLIVLLLAPVGPASGRRPLPQRRAAAAPTGASGAPPVPAPASAPAAVVPPAIPPATDWAAESRAAAEQELEQEERARRQAAAFGPRHSDAFASPKHKPQFHWDYARTHRVEPLKGGIGVAVNINDHCALILFGLIPMAGCTVGKIPVRGDLFEHMRDPPEPGAWQER